MKGKIGLLYGFLIGTIIPIIPYLLLYWVFQLNDLKINDSLASSFLLLFVCLDMFIARRFFNNKYEFAGRGVILSMFGFAVYWVITFAL